MSVKSYNFSKEKNVGVGFHENYAFVVKDENGFFTAQDIQEGVFDAGLLELPYEVEGLQTLALINERKDFSIIYTLQTFEPTDQLCNVKRRELPYTDSELNALAETDYDKHQLLCQVNSLGIPEEDDAIMIDIRTTLRDLA